MKIFLKRFFLFLFCAQATQSAQTPTVPQPSVAPLPQIIFMQMPGNTPSMGQFPMGYGPGYAAAGDPLNYTIGLIASKSTLALVPIIFTMAGFAILKSPMFQNYASTKVTIGLLSEFGEWLKSWIGKDKVSLEKQDKIEQQEQMTHLERQNAQLKEQINHQQTHIEEQNKNIKNLQVLLTTTKKYRKKKK